MLSMPWYILAFPLNDLSCLLGASFFAVTKSGYQSEIIIAENPKKYDGELPHNFPAKAMAENESIHSWV